MSDHRIADRFLRGERQAVETVQEWVRQAAASFRRRLAFEWDDVVQEALVELTADLQAGKFRRQGSFRGYVWRSVNHTCLDRIRRHDRWQWTSVEDLALEGGELSSFGALARREEVSRMLRVASEMPEGCRRLWRMILDGRSYDEMGEELGVAPGTLRVRVLRCRQRAVARWEELWRDRPGSASAAT